MRRFYRAGDKVHRLTLIERVYRADLAHNRSQWRAACECGTEVLVRSAALTAGTTKSCGKGSCKALWTEAPSCSAIHARLMRERGPASAWPCVDCAATAADWSYDNNDPNELRDHRGTYSLELDRYAPRCRSCHVTFDSKFPDKLGV